MTACSRRVDNGKAAAAGISAGWDASLLPLTDAQLEERLSLAVREPVRLVEILRRADANGLHEPAVRLLEYFCQQQPDNAVVHAALALALDMRQGDYNSFEGRILWELTFIEEQKAQQHLHRALELRPEFWLALTVEGHRKLIDHSHRDAHPEAGLRMLRAAADRAPQVAFVRYLLGEALMRPLVENLYLGSERWGEAAVELRAAPRRQPVIAHASWLLVELYDQEMQNPTAACEAARRFLTVLPPGVVLSHRQCKILGRLGVTREG